MTVAHRRTTVLSIDGRRAMAAGQADEDALRDLLATFSDDERRIFWLGALIRDEAVSAVDALASRRRLPRAAYLAAVPEPPADEPEPGRRVCRFCGADIADLHPRAVMCKQLDCRRAYHREYYGAKRSLAR